MGVSATPWLIALIALVCLMTLILAITMFMVWKWKHNRLRDVNESLSHTEGGVARQVFPSSGVSPCCLLITFFVFKNVNIPLQYNVLNISKYDSIKIVSISFQFYFSM